jgi:hypothetical protein
MADELSDNAVSDLRVTFVQVNDGWDRYKAKRGYGVIDDVIKCVTPLRHVSSDDLVLNLSTDAMEKLLTELNRRKSKNAVVTKFMKLQIHITDQSGYAVEVKEVGHE